MIEAPQTVCTEANIVASPRHCSIGMSTSSMPNDKTRYRKSITLYFQTDPGSARRKIIGVSVRKCIEQNARGLLAFDIIIRVLHLM
ncbi:hypothetical protein TNCV_3682791 [Trichonephila clavipes]|uniref:Uncharacterized protein n=1 Tax=Trichonephila clavipes TaxID=2585209 RepID=A0A8X6UXQ1_TRICX|nr:hypothetical protein TNCV_3682791 [Trichonephila clavipes]